MGVYINQIATDLEGILNDILDILGTTKTLFVPGWEGEGSSIGAIGAAGFTSSDEAGAVNLEAEYSPHKMISGLHHYGFVTSLNHNWSGADNAAFTFGDGSADSAFSVGFWWRPNSLAAMDIIAKYNPTAAEEWRVGQTSAGKIFLELYDASANASETGTEVTALTAGKFVFVVVTYDGTAATPDVHIYIDGTDDLPTGATTESGSYVAMEDTATPLLIGASAVTGGPANECSGRLAMPFICGKELTATEVASLYALMKPLVGIA